jgi:polysaccharide export outer membrane protein
MRKWRRRKLIAGIGTALGLCVAGTGCQSVGRITTGGKSAPAATMTAPMAMTTPAPAHTTRAAPPGNEVCWHASGDTAAHGVRAVTYHPSEPPPEGAATDDGLPPLTGAPEPAREKPEGKKGEAKKDDTKKDDTKKDDTQLPAPRPFEAEGPVIHAVPTVPALDAPHELAKRALPSYVIEPPDILLVEAVPRSELFKTDQRIAGQHLVRPDGTIGLGIYGSVFVGGMTLDAAREAVAAQIRKRIPKFDIADLNVDVLAFNSKFYYVITDGGGYGEQVYPFPITGSETVLDAIGRINGLPAVADKKKVWLARRGPGGSGKVLPVDWCGIAQRGGVDTNWQLMPGDRIYVKADHWISTDTWLGKRLNPIQRLLGTTLLGSETVNSIRNRSTSGGVVP